MEKTIKFSFHKDIVGKPVKKEIADKTYRLFCGNKQVNLGYGWINAELQYEEIFVLLTEGGYALGPFLKSDHRDADNFVSHQLALVDIDSGMKIEELQNNEFYNKFGSGYYTTPSHTEQDHRFRIIYRLENPITNFEQMAELYEGLLALHGAADISCKDAARLFYGTVNAASKEITDRVLTQEGIDLALAARAKIIGDRPKRSTVVTPIQTTALNSAEIGEILDELKRHYSQLPYAFRRDITWSVRSQLSDQETINMMRSRWSDVESTASYEDFIKSYKPSALSIGTIIHYIRKQNPNYRKKPAYKNDDFVKDKLAELRLKR